MSDRLGRAIEAFQEGHHKRAIMELNQIVFDEPNNWSARLYLGMACASSGDNNQALRQFYQIYLKCPYEDLREKARKVLPPKMSEQADAERAELGPVS
ncbi:MAG: hypothetical protein K2W95_02005 [Candidatus Obscuribacterales bacterium]|nr:hypothetical protein [Candidatus Obscuribacterales bacterium]